MPASTTDRPVAERPIAKLRAAKMVEAVAAYAMAQAEIDRTKPIILAGMGDHREAMVGNHRVKVSHSEGSAGAPAVKITADMVGGMIPAKKARGAQTRLTVS